MACYNTISEAIEAANDLKEQAALIKEIIAKLYASMTKAAEGASIEEYYLNDGQATVKSVRRSPEQIVATIKALKAQLVDIEAQLCGRSTYLRDGGARC
jgi:hypothetical protein